MVNLADSKDLAEKIMELKNSPELRKKIAENGYQLYKEKLSPRALGKELLDIILTVAKR
jgi:glycosyltransferase involved in cell wall biosynthesis